MNRQIRKEIAKETLEITKNKYYYMDGEKINLPGENYESVIPIHPDIVVNKKPFTGSAANTELCIVEADSFTAAEGIKNCLVMNFANAHTPGGGFLNGANAQEESLCRSSTLYSSISSSAAATMYNYNKRHRSPCDSDYMLLSPNVCVFRNFDDVLIDEPYLTSVITVPAPNRKGSARDVPQEVLDVVMKNRLAKMLFTAIEYGYTNLVLGAWGCGAFAHNPKKVAEYFYELLIKQNYLCRFRNVIFAIVDNREETNLKAFTETFKDVATIYTMGKEEYDIDHEDDSLRFIQAKYPPINFNFSLSNLSEENIGYAYGVISDGCPFMAELWKYGNNQDVAFYLPVIDEFMKLKGKPLINKETGTKTFSYNVEVKGFHALCVGMIDNGFVDDLSVENAYVSFLCKNNLLEFEGQMYSSYAFLLTDSNGHDLIAVTISLIQDGDLVASTPLTWTHFPRPQKKRHLRVVSPSNNK